MTSNRHSADWPASNSEMARLYRGHNWVGTPLGPVGGWPQSLRTLLDLILDSSMMMCLMWGPDAVLLYNEAYARSIGSDHPTALGRSALEVWPDMRSHFDTPLQKALSGDGTVLRDQYLPARPPARTRDGWFDLTYTPIRVENGQVGGVLVSLVDATERVLADRALRESEARLRSVLDGMGEAFGLLDHEFRILTFNEAALRMETRPREEILGRSHWEVYPGSEESEIGHLYKRALAEQQPVSLEHRYTWEDGTARWLEMRAYPVPEGLAVFWHDISERKEAEAELQRSERHFRLMADAVPQIIWITDAEGRTEFFNKQWSDYTGVPYEPTTAAEIAANHVHPDDGAATILAFDEARRSGTTFLLEHRIRSASGAYRWFLVRAEPYRDPETGKIERWFGVSIDIDDRKRAEAELRESEERLRAILETATDYAIFTTDAGGRIETWPAGAQAVFGWAAAEAIGQSVDMTFTPEDRAQGAPETERVTARAVGHAPNVRWHLRKDGSRVFIDGVTRPLTGSDGALVGFLKVGQDVTERRRAEEQLQLATEAAALGIFDVDFTTGQMAWDARQRELWGLGPDQVITDEVFLAGIHPEDRDRVQAALAQTFSQPGDGLYHAEFRLRPRDNGGERWIAATGRVHFEAGQPVRLIGTVQDISERKRTEAALRESEARLRKLNETLEQQVTERTADRDRMWRLTTDIMLVARFDGQITAINPAWERLLGWSESELLGRAFFEFVHPDDLESTLAEAGRLSEGATTFRFENRYQAKDGSYLWISWIAVPESGLIHAVGRDITDERERQAELEAAQEQLRQSQKMEAMGQLTGGVAHDFNNLLTPIIASLDMLLRRGVGSERERRLMDGALQSAERAKTLVQRLLAFARRQPLQPGPVDVKRLVTNMAELVASTLGPRIDVRVELPDDLPPALADANQLEMAVLNLAVNARDAMPDAGVLTISAARESVRGPHPAKLGHGHYLCLSVKDTGTGMDEATLARAVEPFFSTKGIGKGTGLGLSMVHGLAEQLGGGMTITSSLGQGTTVELWLPISPFAAEEKEPTTEPTSTPQARGTTLLVDDEDLVRMSTADMLMDLGYEVVEARSAEEAFRIVAKGLHPDLVVTDHLMPGMTGVDLARDLRHRWPDLPVLIVSGYAEVEGLAPGFPRLTKPFRSAELAASLTTLMPAADE